MVEGMKQVDYDSYCESLAAGARHKANWWTHYIPDRCPWPGVFDFGCADGSVLKACPFWGVGYDADPFMIRRVGPKDQNGNYYFSDLDEAIAFVLTEYVGRTKILLLSSVLHELFQDPAKVYDKSLTKVMEAIDPDYIVVRDMGRQPQWHHNDIGNRLTLELENALRSTWNSVSEAERDESYFTHTGHQYVAMLRGVSRRAMNIKHFSLFTPDHVRERLTNVGYNVGTLCTHFQAVLEREDLS